MSLDAKTKKKICDFVYTKPRSVNEIAKAIGKNWRTADRYVQKIEQDDSCISTRTFREGTRGALKIVFWSNIEKIHSSSFQEQLFRQIESGREKPDFDPFDIYQYIDEQKKSAFAEKFEGANISTKQNLFSFLTSAESAVYIFSGNLSWINVVENKKKMISAIENLVKRNVRIKILCRVDFASTGNLKEIYAINNKFGKELIEIRHCKQPLRGFIVDNKTARFKEEKISTKYKKGELPKNLRLFMEIYDEEWIEWLRNVFNSLFRNSIDANKRIKEIEKIKI